MAPLSLFSYLLVFAKTIEIDDLLLTHPQGLLKHLGFCHTFLLCLFQAEEFWPTFSFLSWKYLDPLFLFLAFLWTFDF